MPNSKDMKPAKRSVSTRKWLKYGVYGIGGVALSVIGLAGLAGTGPVLRLVTPMINETVATATDSQFEMGRIEGSLWTGLHLDRLLMDRQADGFHLELSDVEFDWSPLALFGGRLQINRVGLASANVFLPDGSLPDDAPEEDTEISGGFALPLAVSLDALELGEIAIVDQISGNSFLYSLRGKARVGTNLSADAAIDLEPRDSGTDRLKLDLSFDGPKQQLAAEIDGALGRDGLVMTLAGVDPEVASDIKIALNGDGPANDWKGKLDLTASGYAALSSDIGVQLSSDVLAFSLDGGLTPLERITEQLPEPLQKTISLGIGGAFDQAEQTLGFDRINVAIPDAVSLGGAADLDLDESLIAANVTADIDPSLSALIDDAVSWGQLGLSIKANGNLAMPGVEVSLNGRDVQTPVSMISNVAVQASMTAPDEGAALMPKLSVSTDGSTWNDPGLGAFLGARQDVSVDAQIAPSFDQFMLRNLVIAAPQMTLRGQADLDESFAVSNANLAADIADLAIFAPISGLDLSGKGDVRLDNLIWSTEQGLNTDIAIATTQTGFGIADLDRIVGPSPVIKGAVSLSPGLDLAVDIPNLETAMITGPIKVDIGQEFAKLAVTSELDLAPGVVPPGIGVAIAPAKLNVALDGDIAAPPGNINLRVPSVEAGGQKFENVRLGTNMTWSDQAVLSLNNRVQFALAGWDYDLGANVILPSDGLRVEAISLRGDHIELTGAIGLPDYSVPMRGALSLSRLDAQMLGDFGVPFANGAITADVGFESDGTRQTVSLAAVAKGLRMAGEDDANPTMIEDVVLDATVGNAFDAPEINAEINGSDIAAGPMAIRDVVLRVTGGLDALAVALQSSGTFQGNVPVKTDLAADLSLGDDTSVTASKLNADIGDQKIALDQPLQFVLTKAGRQQLDASLKVGSGTLTANLEQEAAQKSISGDVVLSAVELGPWGRIVGFDGLSGTANLSASLRETRGVLPTANVKGRITGIRAKAVQDMQPFEMALDVDLAKGELAGQASLGNSDVQILSAKGNVPLAISVLEQNFSPDMTAPISASVRIDGEIAEFWPYVPAPDHVMSGDINLALDVGGTLDDIRWEGNMALADGRYENLVYGTILDEMTLAGTFDQSGLSIPSFTATDGGKGTVNASVDVKMGDGGAVDYDVAAKLVNVALSRKDELQFWANVDSKVTGNLEGADIQSTVAVQRGEVDLTLALPESVPTIEVANLPTAKEEEAAKKAKENESGFKGNLDVVVDIPGRLFVRGKGLDSEWGGRLEISGTTDEPIITGQLSALRGQLDIIGKTFVIKDSKITFAGGSPPDPMLDIAGVYTTDDLVVTAGFQGAASDPELVLTSNPSLPEDEILSQVLFGKSQGSLSAVEAVQLASALNELSGGGTGLDVVGSIRRFIGADVLQVGGGESGPEVKVGKYLTEGVYVGTKAGATPGSSGVEVEIEITPNISVTSETTEIDSKAGVQYRLDY